MARPKHDETAPSMRLRDVTVDESVNIGHWTFTEDLDTSDASPAAPDPNMGIRIFERFLTGASKKPT